MTFQHRYCLFCQRSFDSHFEKQKYLWAKDIFELFGEHYSDVIMSAMESKITGVSIVCSIVCSGVDQRKHQNSASLAFVMGMHRWPLVSPHKGPVTRKMFPHDDVTTGNSIFYPSVYNVDIDVLVTAKCFATMLSLTVAFRNSLYPKMNTQKAGTVKPVYNDHIMGYFSAFWISSRWPRAT